MEDNYQIEQTFYNVLPIKNNVVFPGVLLPIAVSKKSSLKLIKAAEKENRPLLLLTQKDGKVSKEPKELLAEDQLFTLGVLARVIQVVPVPEMGRDTMMAVFEGLQRVQALDMYEENGVLQAHALEVEEHMPLKNDKQFKATVENIKETVLKILSEQDGNTTGLESAIRTINSTPTLVNYVCAIYHMPTEAKQGLLEIHSLTERAEALLTILQKDLDELIIKADVRRRTAEKIDQRQREYFLQQEMETIKKDLGDEDSNEQTIKELRERAKDKSWSEAVGTQFEKELKRLEHMHMHAPD